MRTRIRAFAGGLVVGLLLASGGPTRATGHLGIRHQFVSPKTDGSDATLVQPSNWNAEHTFDVLAFGAMTAPPTPIDGDCWMEAAGTSPSRTLAWKCRDSGVTRTVSSITF